MNPEGGLGRPVGLPPQIAGYMEHPLGSRAGWATDEGSCAMRRVVAGNSGGEVRIGIASKPSPVL
jgi:hypothetical protein